MTALSVKRLLKLPDDLPASLLWASVLYLLHLCLQAWVFSSELTAFASIGSVMYALWRKQIRFSYHILYLPLIVYGTASSLSAILNGSSHAYGECGLWFKIFLFPSALILFREIPRLRQVALGTYILFGFGMASIGLAQFVFMGHHDLEHRINGTAAHVMTFSGMLLPVSLLMAVLAIHWKKLWLMGATAVVTLALLLTYTRSAWLGWVVAVFLLLLLTRPLWAFYTGIALLYFVIFSPVSVFSRLVSTFDTRQESNFDRIRMVQAGIEIIKDYPLLGVGPANMKAVYPLYRKHDAPRFRIPHLHNNVIQIWAERGIMALLGYLLLLILFFRACARAWRGPNRALAEAGIVIAAGLACAGLFEFNFGDSEVFWIMLDLFALVVASTEPPLPDAGWVGDGRPTPDSAAGMTALPQLVPAGQTGS
jgi:O-antigen ligase